MAHGDVGRAVVAVPTSPNGAERCGSTFPPIVSRNPAVLDNASETFLGVCDALDGRVLRGWALRQAPRGDFSETSITVLTPEGTYVVPADLPRDDLRRLYGTNFGGFRFVLSKPFKASQIEIRLQSGALLEIPQQPCGTAEAVVSGNLDSYECGVFRGWASTGELDGRPCQVELLVNGISVASSLACEHREDVYSEVGLGPWVGFRLRPPLSVPREKPCEFEVRASGVTLGRRELRIPKPRVVIVSETESLDDASRRFRCEHLRHHLMKDGFDARVVGPAEFHQREWPGLDVLVFARCGADDQVAEKIHRYKQQYGTKIVYEIDDLVFLPWHTHDLGSVRSGVDRPDDPALRAMFARRLRLLLLADAAITTTHKLGKHLSAFGLPVLQLPNMVPVHEISVRREEALLGEEDRARVLCMAGSPTHYKDFQQVEGALEKAARRYRGKLAITLLGRFREDLHLSRMPNVHVMPRVPYEEMLYVIDSHDACLVPLEATEFNDAKSCLKFVECGARGVPVIASAADDYRRVINDKNGLLIRDAAEWSDAIDLLVESPQTFRQLGMSAQEVVFNDFCIENSRLSVGGWLREVLG